jgi:phosphonate transport system permease protein
MSEKTELKSDLTATVPPLKPKNYARSAAWVLAVIVLALIYNFSFCAVEFDAAKLVGGLPRMANFLASAFPPDWSVLWTVMRETILTIQIALISTTIATLFALPLSFVAAMDLSRALPVMRIPLGLIKWFSRFIFNLVRSIDTLIFAFIFVWAVGVGAFPGMLALAIHSIGMLGKLFTEVIEGIDRGPVEALEAVGAGRMAKIRWAVVPQVLPMFISYFLYRFEINIRVAVVLGLVGAGGIGFLLQTYMNLARYQRVSVVVISILVLVMSIDYLTGWMRRRVA